MIHILSDLNPEQRESVETTEGPVLIIAGAGSGKTKALTHRVAYLIREKNVSPYNILAVTFTNKAAQEMKERIEKLLRSEDGGEERNFAMPIVGTFHAICVRILRREIEKIGYKKAFVILDEDDQLALIKRAMKDLGVPIDQFKPQAIRGTISKAKNELTSTSAFAASIGGYYEEIVSKIYSEYQKRLKDQGALDFDDILMLTIEIFEQFPEVLEKYQTMFRYIMVDEYQDTNHAQYVLVSLLAKKWRNLCVVGDDWQSIYGWRGANIKNILDFEKEYPEAKVVKLEQNYRSTQHILDAAYGVISKNVHRKDKKIWTENKGGHLLTSYEARDEKEEAEYVAKEVLRFHRENSYKLSDLVVLYRTNVQSRMIEEAMLKYSIPYKIIGGIKFYQRKEIKDVLAYLRLVYNFADVLSLERVINEPRRGVGKSTMAKWSESARESRTNCIEWGLKISNSQIAKAKIDIIVQFCEFIKRMKEVSEKITLTDFMEKVFKESGYEKFLMDGTEEGEMRHENVRELFTVAKKYDEFGSGHALAMFLEEVALVSEVDNVDQSKEALHLMTLHSAKGLEFKVVFIVGLEEGILPHSRSLLNGSEMEEERRLMYVGVTRAREKVYMLFTRERNIFGSMQANPPSRFLDDIPEHLIEVSPNSKIQKFKIFEESIIRTKKLAKRQTVLNQNLFKDGDRVRHEVFGDGIVVSSKGDVAIVAFSKAGIKKLLAEATLLKKI